MGKLIKEKDAKGRLHIDTPLMGESLVDRALLKSTEAGEYFRMQPDVNVLKIGGQSIMDRGAKALFPILEELVKAKEKHKILLMCGGGTRARHVYSIGVDLGMPTGVLSKLGDKVSAQNAEMLSVLLAKHGGAMIGHGAHLEQLHMYCQLGYLPITTGIPPYGFFEHPAEHGSIPPHRRTPGPSFWPRTSARVRSSFSRTRRACSRATRKRPRAATPSNSTTRSTWMNCSNSTSTTSSSSARS